MTVNGVISKSPPILACNDCGTQWTDGGRNNSIAYAVIQSRNSGWGFLRCCDGRTRRCSDCNEKHRQAHREDT